MKNPAAVALGRLAKGVPNTLTAAQRKFRGRQLAAARKKRHDKPKRAARLPNKDYTQPLKIRWRCHKHHFLLHPRTKSSL